MRKLLMAGAAMFGASAAMMGMAAAQTNPVAGLAAGQNAIPANPMAGTVTMPQAAGSYTYGDNNYMLGTPTKGAVANPTPGTMVVRLGVRVFVDANATFSNLNNVTTAAGTNKLYPYTLSEYMRIYPGVDAMTANGLRYGAAVELRQNYGTPATSSTASSGGTAYTSSQTVFVRRAFAYLGGDQWGIVRIGEMDGLIGTYDNGGATTGVYLSPTGTIVGGDLQGNFVGNAWMTPFFAAQSGNEYGNTKIVYLSPSFSGFDVGLQYAPNPFNGYAIGSGACASAAGGADCVNAASVPGTAANLGFGSRTKDQFAAGLHYQGPVGPVALLAYGVYMTSGHTNWNGSAALARATGPAGNTYTGQFDNLNLGSFGVNATYAGISVFANSMIGDYNGILALKPAGAPSAKGVVAGVKYVNGPASIGALYGQFDSQGAQQLTGISQRHEWEVYVAATYSLAPGLVVFADYNYGQRHQGGFNFATNSVLVDRGAYNDVTSQGFLLGTAVKW